MLFKLVTIHALMPLVVVEPPMHSGLSLVEALLAFTFFYFCSSCNQLWWSIINPSWISQYISCIRFAALVIQALLMSVKIHLFIAIIWHRFNAILYRFYEFLAKIITHTLIYRHLESLFWKSIKQWKLGEEEIDHIIEQSFSFLFSFLMFMIFVSLLSTNIVFMSG